MKKSPGPGERVSKNAGTLPATSRESVWLFLPPLAAGVIVYLNSLGAGFVYDDNQQIVDNPWVHDLRLLPRLLTHTVWAFKTGGPVNYYRPVQMGLYNLLWTASGGNPLPFHLANLLLHLAVTAGLFFLVRRLSRSGLPAMGAALLFAVHPLNTQTVDWVACVPELTYALFGLATLALHAASWEAEAPRRRILKSLAVVLFLLALFSKETALTILVLIPLMEWLLRPARPKDRSGVSRTVRARRGLVAAVPYAVAAAAYLAIRVEVLGSLAPMRRTDLTAADAVLNAPLLLLRYLGMMAAPVKLLADRVLEPLPSFGHPAFLLSLLGVTALVLTLVWLARRAPDLVFAGALAILPILPVLYLPAVGGAAFAERYAYLPVAGFTWLVAGAVWAVAGRLSAPGRAPSVFLAVVLLIGAIGAVRTLARNPVWHDDGRLAAATLRDEPRAWQMYVILGNWHEREGRPEEAMRAYDEGLRVFPDKPQLRAADINVRLKLHRIGPEEAIRDYLPLAQAYPSLYEVQYNLGDACLKAGRPAEAEQAFRRAVALNPGGMQAREGLTLAIIAQGREPEGSGGDDTSLSPVARSRARLIQAVAAMQAGRLEEAEAMLQEALRLDPKSDRALLSLAVLESRRGDDRAAVEDCRKALALDPTLADAYEQMGVSGLRLGDLPEAIRNLEKATNLDSTDKEALSRLGVAYAQGGRPEEARKAFEKALALDAGFEKARHNLERLQELERRKDR